MKQKAKVRLFVEELGARVLPSANPVAPPIFAPALNAPEARPGTLTGHGSGSYVISRDVMVPDRSWEYQLSGTVNLVGYGTAQLNGSLFDTGFAPPGGGRAGGTLTFRSSNDVLTIHLSGPLQQAGLFPDNFQYQVTSATGQFQKLLNQQGRMLLKLKPSTDVPTPSSPGRGAFNVTLAQHFFNGVGTGVSALRTFDPVTHATHFTFTGTAVLSGVGQVQVRGTMDRSGALGRNQGECILTQGTSSATLELIGAPLTSTLTTPDALRASPAVYQYWIKAATGKFAAYRNQWGAFVADESAFSPPFTGPIRMARALSASHFVFRFSQNPIAGVGSASTVTQAVQSGYAYKISGHVTLTGLGYVKITGDLATDAQGRVTGTWTLSNGKSAIALKLTSSAQATEWRATNNIIAELPLAADYRVSFAMGDFKKFKGQLGKLNITMKRFVNTPMPSMGSFDVAFS